MVRRHIDAAQRLGRACVGSPGNDPLGDEAQAEDSRTGVLDEYDALAKGGLLLNAGTETFRLKSRVHATPLAPTDGDEPRG